MNAKARSGDTKEISLNVCGRGQPWGRSRHAETIGSSVHLKNHRLALERDALDFVELRHVQP